MMVTTGKEAVLTAKTT